MTALRLCIFGVFGIASATRDPAPLQRQPALQALLAFLALHPGAPLPRQQIAFTLWPDTSEKQARANLRQSLYALRAMLGDDLPLRIDPQTVALERRGGLWIDVWVFDEHMRAAQDDPGLLQAAVDCYRGALLEGCYADWVLPFRERYERLYQQALARLADHAERGGDRARAIGLTRRLLASDPFQERAVRDLMRRLARAGDRAAALACFEQFRRLIAAELDAAPLEETAALAEQIARAEPAPADALGELPVYATPFFGREAELAAIGRLLDDPACRLIVLVGMGGIGKTRLAVQAANASRARFPDGVAFVALAESRTAGDLSTALADALKVPARAGAAPEQALRSYLRARRMLLVLDNAESLGGQTEPLGALLRQAPELRLIVTSRERLYLSSEWLLPVDGLALPSGQSAAALERSSAAQLFLQRVRMVRSGFEPSPEDLHAVAQICRRLDGMPLGLELAAAWARAATCAQIADLLAGQMIRLAVPLRDLAARHRSLHAVIAHSWASLDGAEQQALRRMTVFRGGCAQEQAQRVTEADLLTLAALVDKSLLRWEGGRYHIHELVRQFLEQTGAPAEEQTALRLRHFASYLMLAEAAAAHLGGLDQPVWMERIERDYDNLRAAFDWACAQTDSAPALRLCEALWMFWYVRGHLSEGWRWCEAALAHDARQPPARGSELRATVLSQAGSFAHLCGHAARAGALHEQSLALRRELGLTHAIAASLNNLGLLAEQRGDYAEAVGRYQEAIALWRAQGRQDHLATTLNNLGVVYFALGQHDRAGGLYDESLAIWRALADPYNIGLLLYNLGDLALAEARHEPARRLLGEALAMLQGCGERRLAAHVWVSLGRVALELAQVDQARVCLGQALALLRETEDRLMLARCLEVCAALALALQRPADAVRLLAHARHMRAGLGAPPNRYDRREAERTAAQARAALADGAGALAEAEGLRLPWEQILQTAVGLSLPTPAARPQLTPD